MTSVLARPPTIPGNTWKKMTATAKAAAVRAYEEQRVQDANQESQEDGGEEEQDEEGQHDEEQAIGDDAPHDFTVESFAPGMNALTDGEKALLQLLLDTNGQDAYSNEAQALGRLGVNEFLILPEGFNVPTVHAKDVGTREATGKFKLKDLAEIYALNKSVAPTSADAIKYGMARMEAVKMGWFNGQREVTRRAAIANSVTTFLADLATVDIEEARAAAYLVPLAAEHVFRTTGHHYLSGQGAEYDKKYAQLFKSCLAESVKDYQPAGVLYHAMFHWVSPARVWAVIMAKAGTDTLPEAFALRVSSAPAGTAIITTTAAVLEQLEAAALLEDFKRIRVADFDVIKAVAKKIKANPPKYHKVPHAYGRSPLNAVDKAEVDRAASEAVKMASVAQGFIEALFANAALGRAKVFKKHADENPIATKKAKLYFKGIVNAKVAVVEDIFAGTATTVAKLARQRALRRGTAHEEEEQVEEDE